MLFTLHIKNIALLDDVSIEFQSGFNVLSGETGAGKSILIGSINLLLGERANRELIRHGEDKAMVCGLFYVEDEEIKNILSEKGFEADEDGSFVLSRELFRDGKNLCKIMGRTVSLSELREVAGLFVNIHGQHDSQALLNPQEHIYFLDSFLKEDGKKLLNDYQESYKVLLSLRADAESLDVDEKEKLRKIDVLSYEIDEIESASLSPEEEDELKHQKDILNHKKKLEEKIATALTALSDHPEDQDVVSILYIAKSALEYAAGLDSSLEPVAESIEGILTETDDVVHTLRNYFDALTENSLPVDEIEARLDVIYRLKRKYGATVSDVLAHMEACKVELEKLQNLEIQKDALLEKIKEQESITNEKAKKLSVARNNACAHIEAQINENLHFLNMPHADFKIALSPAPLYLLGAEQVQFMIRTNAGEDYLPLDKIVSGGELSRIMLAIQSVLTDGDHAKTLIFDEIDAGVGGSAAQKIGRKLYALSQNKQVLCVTHLAQIAAMANTHYLIEKEEAGGRTKTKVTLLNKERQLYELARMIGGDAVSDTTLKQAEELIEFGQKNH